MIRSDDATLDRKTRRTERSRRWEPVSRRGKAAQITTGACLAFAATLTVWSAWAELTCPYGGPVGREWCRTTVGVGGIFVMAGVGVAALGTVIALRGLLRPVDPFGGDGWTWGEGVLIALAGLVLGLMVIDSPVCPGGYDMATGFDLCVARGDASVRVEATSRLDLRGEFFGEQDGAFGLATGAEIPGAAGECRQMILSAFRAANARETPLEPATTQELLYGTNHNRPQRARARLEAFFVTADVTVEVVLEELIKRRSFGMPGLVLPRRFGNRAAAGILDHEGGLGDAATGEDRLADAGHGGLTSSGGRFGAAHSIEI